MEEKEMKKLLLVVGLCGVVAVGIVTPTFAAATGPTSQMIEGAKREGSLSAKLRTGLTETSMTRLEREIRQKYGVSLKITSSPSGNMPKDLSEAVMELKAGVPPSYDVMNFLDSFVPVAMQAGVLERTNWKPLISENTNPKAVLDHPELLGAIVYYTGHLGLMYNSQKVPANQVPKSLADLANPRWKGKVGVFTFEETWARWAFILGKEKVFSAVEGILRNGAVRGRFVDLQNRFLLGELSLCFTGSVYLKEAQDKGLPAAWKTLNLGEIQNFTLSLRKGAKHPNAAQLVAIYLASPEGSRFILEESGAGN